MTDIIFVTNGGKADIIREFISMTDGGRILFTGLDDSASANRNFGLTLSTSEIFIMLDDDITGFYQGWSRDLIKPMLSDPDIIACSARLLKQDGRFGHMMGGNGNRDSGVHDVPPSAYRGFRRLPTACVAIRRNSLRFDTGFIGSGYEDTDYFNRLNLAFPGKRIVINNDCKLIHLNEEKNQGGKYFEHNKMRYLSLWPDDMTVLNQRDWTRRKR